MVSPVQSLLNVTLSKQQEAKLLLRMAVETGSHRPMDRTGWELVDRLVLTFPRMAR